MANKMAEKKKQVSRMVEPSQSSESTRQAKQSSTRDERKERPKVESKAVRREGKGKPSLLQRFRNSRIGRFILEAYYELRHKVTWPTFQEAMNMTIAVIVLSVVIGGLLSLADLGLSQLFLKLVSGK